MKCDVCGKKDEVEGELSKICFAFPGQPVPLCFNCFKYTRRVISLLKFGQFNWIEAVKRFVYVRRYTYHL